MRLHTHAQDEERDAAAGLSPAQVQVCWDKETLSEVLDIRFPTPAERLAEVIRAAARELRRRFPNLQHCYISSRICGGYSDREALS